MGMQHGAAGLGAALVTVLIPIFVYILMVFSKKSQPTLKEWFALLFGIMGVSFMMNFEQLSLSEWMRGGNLYFVLAAFFYALITVFGAFMRDEAFERGPDALAETIAYDQKAIIQDNLAYIQAALDFTELTLYDITSDTNIPGKKQKIEGSVPGQPTFDFVVFQ